MPYSYSQCLGSFFPRTQLVLISPLRVQNNVNMKLYALNLSTAKRNRWKDHRQQVNRLRPERDLQISQAVNHVPLGTMTPINSVAEYWLKKRAVNEDYNNCI